MGVFDTVNIKIRGQVKEGTGNVAVAELRFIAAKYNLEVEGGFEFLGELE